MQSALNKQIQEEMYSAYLYYAMAAWVEAQNLIGMAMWLKVQAMEEITHAHRFFAFIYERQGQVELFELAKPPKEWKSPLDAFEAAYKHEQHISGCINDLMKLSREIGDYTTETGVLHWFVIEQIEEEQQTDAIVQKLKMIGDDKNGLVMLDKELAMRVFTWPIDLEPSTGAA